MVSPPLADSYCRYALLSGVPCFGSHHPFFEDRPFRIGLRGELFAAVVEEITTSLGSQRVHEKPALKAPGYDHPPNGFEVRARVGLAPRRAARGQRLQTH